MKRTMHCYSLQVLSCYDPFTNRHLWESNIRTPRGTRSSIATHKDLTRGRQWKMLAR